MNRKTRKHIWPVALMSLAVFGVVAAFVALSAMQPEAARADGCDQITDPTERAQCLTRHDVADLDSTNATHEHEPTGGTSGNGGNGTPANGSVTAAAMTVPTEFEGSALDNGTRLSWEAPEGRPQDADDVDANLVGYEIFREAYLEDSNNPLLTNNPTATIEIDDAAEVSHRDLGLSYGVTYTYKVRAVFEMTDPNDEDETIKVYSDWSDAYTLIVADLWRTS